MKAIMNGDGIHIRLWLMSGQCTDFSSRSWVHSLIRSSFLSRIHRWNIVWGKTERVEQCRQKAVKRCNSTSVGSLDGGFRILRAHALTHDRKLLSLRVCRCYKVDLNSSCCLFNDVQLLFVLPFDWHKKFRHAVVQYIYIYLWSRSEEFLKNRSHEQKNPVESQLQKQWVDCKRHWPKVK